MSSKNIVWGVVTFVLIIGGLWGIWNVLTQPNTPAQEKKVDVDIAKTDHVRGPQNAPVTIVEYSDLQCPACRAYAPLVKSILEKNPATVRLVYRHFPLEMHKHAQSAAYAAEAAGKQGKFFEYHDILFDKQAEWEAAKDVTSLFEKYARELKLDMKKFTTDQSSSEIKDRVESQRKSGIDLQVNATPTFIVNGIKIENPKSLDEFQKLIDAAYDGPKESTDSGMTPTVSPTGMQPTISQ